jgi:DNA-binding HxlR family transcriptional regulator
MERSCTVYKLTNMFGKRWVLQILLEIYKKDSQNKFSDIKRSVKGITAKLLSSRLKDLENNGLIRKRIDTSVFPVRCYYRLSQSGKDFIRIIDSMKKWALKWNVKNKICKNTECAECKL